MEDRGSGSSAPRIFRLRLVASQEYVLLLDRANWLHPLGFRPRIRLDVHFPTLPEGSVELFPIGYTGGDDRREWMEYLECAGYIEVPAQRPQAVYARIQVPAEQEPGEQAGQVMAYSQHGFGEEELFWSGKISLHIATAILPDPAQWTFHLNLWQHCTSLARYYRVQLWSDEHFAIIDRYYAKLAQLGQRAVSVIAAEIPWSVQRCFRDPAYPSYLFEHAIIDVEREESGELMIDYRKLDRLLSVAARHGIDREMISSVCSTSG